MGLFSSNYTGTIKACDNSGRRFEWKIPKFADTEFGASLDSDTIANFAKAKFHLHLSIGDGGEIGLYIHYKKTPIPKYSYCFLNSRGHAMRQHTAHTIPADTDRCGHWNLCAFKEMNDFLGFDDTLTVRVNFDDDTISIRKKADKNLTSVFWTIPNFSKQNVHPFTSVGFGVDDTTLACRMDTKRREGSGPLKLDSSDDIEKYIFFLFCRTGKIPLHTIELIDSSGKVFLATEKKEDGNGVALMIDRSELLSHIGADDALFVNFALEIGGNPLEMLNLGFDNNSNNGAA